MRIVAFFTSYDEVTPRKLGVEAASGRRFIFRFKFSTRKSGASSGDVVRKFGVPDQTFMTNEPFSRRSLDFKSAWYLSLGVPIFVFIRRGNSYSALFASFVGCAGSPFAPPSSVPAVAEPSV